MKLCFATNNKNKIEEVQALLNDSFRISGLHDIGCSEELAETQDTLEGNSLQKANYVYKNYSINVFADDTGLEVEALDGEPGIKSARYAGDHRDNEANINLLLANLGDSNKRHAQFRTIITLIHNNLINQFEGVVKGQITIERKGGFGFGYDSVFVPDGYNITFAQMPLDQKNKISHRGLAIEKLVDYLNSLEVG